MAAYLAGSGAEIHGAPEPAPAATEAAPEPEGPLSLEAAIEAALLRNPELEGFAWETRAAEARGVQAGKAPNPEIDIRLYDLDSTSEDDPANGNDNDADENDAEEDSRKRVILSQAFELGGKQRRREDLARAERDLADVDYRLKRAEITAIVTERFYAVLGAERRVASWGGFVEFVEEMAGRVRRLVETGALRSVEVLRVERRLGEARMELETARSELAAARLLLAVTWGSVSPKFTTAEGDLERVKPVPSFEAVQALARTGPAVARFETDRARAEAAHALARSERVPDLTAGVGVRWDESFGSRDYLVDFRIALPLFDRKQGDIQEAAHGIARADADRRFAQATAAEAIALHYYPLLASDARRATLAKDVLPASRAAFEAFRQGLDRRLEDPDDALDARRDLASAEVDYTDALVEYHRALAALEGALGASLDAAPAP
jgi:cobalt-zinc-cadmium efflux system outer membrane protein